jgi:hypothetical protein
MSPVPLTAGVAIVLVSSQCDQCFLLEMRRVWEAFTFLTKEQTWLAFHLLPSCLLSLNMCDTGYSRGTCTPMLIAALFTIAKLWKQPRCPTTDEWIKKMWYLYRMEYYSAMKKNEILSFSSKWMELENIILSEVSQAQKTKNHMFSLICGL